MNLNYHFETETFKASWQEWKDYRKKVLKKPIKDEQRALNNIFELSHGSEQIAYLIMKRSMDNEYQGLFPLPINYQTSLTNGQTNNGQPTGTKVTGRGDAQSFYSAITGQNNK